MSVTEVNVGEIYAVKNGKSCSNFDVNPNSKFIRILTSQSQLHPNRDIHNYEILDQDQIVIGECNVCFEAKDLIPLSANSLTPSIMQKLSTWMKRNFNASQKTLYKAGFINSDLTPTEKGLTELQALFWSEHEKELVALAEAELKEQEDSNE